eukprot:990703_1
MADTLFHFPLNSLMERINNESIDGLQLIQSLTMEQHNINAFHIIVAETGWDKDEVHQILSVLFRHHTWTQSEFTHNMNRVWAKPEYNTLRSSHLNDPISTIQCIILKHDVEKIHYHIKNANPIAEFSDCIINMVDEIMQTNKEKQTTLSDENDCIKCIYEGIAECFIF